MSFMMRIEAAQRPPLEQLAVDFNNSNIRGRQPSLDFCRRVLGVPERDEVVAKRLAVPVALVRAWREIGRRACPGGCR